MSDLAITVWRNGGWRLWQVMDAQLASADPNWLCTIPLKDVDAYRAVIEKEKASK